MEAAEDFFFTGWVLKCKKQRLNCALTTPGFHDNEYSHQFFPDDDTEQFD
jgi:hypothetical protein